MLENIRRQIRELLEARATHEATMNEVTTAVEARGADESLTEDEQTQFNEAREAITSNDTERAELEVREGELVAEAAANAAAEAARERFAASGVPDLEITSQPATYRANGDHQFFSDAWRAQFRSDPVSRERIERNAREMTDTLGESRAVGSAAFGGLIVPQYLVDLFTDVLRDGRAYINAIRSMPLPEEGMVLTVPRGQTGSSVAAQATENAAVSNTNVDFDNDLAINVRTYSGEQDVSRQSLERGTPGIDTLVFSDLVGDYAEELDTAAINGDGLSGTHLGVLNTSGIISVTYTDASPSVAEVWPRLAQSVGNVGSQRKRSASLLVMTPLRWSWFIASLDTTNRPLINPDPAAARNAMGTMAENFAEGQLVGLLMGKPVLVDGNIPETLGAGTEDAIMVLRASDQIIWEEGDGMPRELMFEETDAGNLQVKLLVYGYSAFTAARRPLGAAVIAGTGLIAPTF